jgi:hypothetical protein
MLINVESMISCPIYGRKSVEVIPAILAHRVQSKFAR